MAPARAFADAGCRRRRARRNFRPMSYLEQHLLAGERIVYRAHLHWIVYITPIALLVLAAAAAAAVALGLLPHDVLIGAAVVLALAAALAVPPWLRCRSSEFAVTDKRVVVKLGLVQRDSLETLLSKIEAIGVDQDTGGRLFDYGTVTVIGTGGTREAFDRIAHPLEFRRQVQAQIVALEESRGGARPAADVVAPRDERECPYCAERILTRARICRFCGHDVTPAA